MEIRLTANSERSMEYFVKYNGPKTIFGSRENRENLDRSQAVERFEREWSQGLRQEAEQSKECDFDTASAHLIEEQQKYLEHSKKQCFFRYRDKFPFVMQLNRIESEIYELDQIWFIQSPDYDPRCLTICFETERERKQFEDLAKRKNYKYGRDLVWKLVQDFKQNQNE